MAGTVNENNLFMAQQNDIRFSRESANVKAEVVSHTRGWSLPGRRCPTSRPRLTKGALCMRLAKMNLAIRGIDGQIAHGDTFHNNRSPDLKADYILANLPLNVSDWGGERLRDDKRWKYGVPPTGNANFAWVQHIIHHLAPAGVAGFVLANGSMSSNQSGEGEMTDPQHLLEV